MMCLADIFILLHHRFYIYRPHTFSSNFV